MYQPSSHRKPSTKPNGRIRNAKECFFCVNNVENIDYKDARLLRRFTSSHAKIAPTRRDGLCDWHQRKLATAIKRARIMALLPFVIN
ncbi:30S ribosomal protein S18 [Candidatus Uhrbacteria bacterium]|nr:30S ribosomal protein S18 [Candidatus Uhrbacteria bacterium]